MKIAQVISTPPFAWATGGSSRVAYELSKELAKRGHDVTILTTDLYKPGLRSHSCNSKIVDGITVLRFSYISDFLAWNHKIYISPSLIKYLFNNLNNYDIVHLQDLISVHAISTYFYCAMNNIPYVVTTHGSIPWLAQKNFAYKFVSIILKRLLVSSSKVLALSDTEAMQCVKLGINKKKIEIVPNGINYLDYELKIAEGAFKEKYRIGKRDKIILYVGRIHESKGLDLLINAFSKILVRLPNTVLVMIGPDDGYKSRLLSLVKSTGLEKKVFFTDFIDDQAKILAFKEADVFVTPKFSGFPITFLEACACGTPIITTNIGDELQWIHNNVGFVTNYSEIELANAVCVILENDLLRETFRYNMKKMILEKFNWQVIAQKVEYIYNTVHL